jgi:DNA invertase Pin-like site-specific DNA recombinase
MATGRFVSYLRVSTKRQGESGLGLEAQRAAIEDFLNGGNWQIVAEFVEVESGKRNNRPELAKALSLAKATGSTLLVAKLDRLSRNAAFLLTLRDSNVDFVAADMPDANRLTVGILAVVAQDERERISQRTKAALQAAKARGVKLGCPNGAAHLKGLGNAAAVAEIGARAQERAEGLREIVTRLIGEGVRSQNGLARSLNTMGVESPRGGAWQGLSVRRLLARLKIIL